MGVLERVYSTQRATIMAVKIIVHSRTKPRFFTEHTRNVGRHKRPDLRGRKGPSQLGRHCTNESRYDVQLSHFQVGVVQAVVEVGVCHRCRL